MTTAVDPAPATPPAAPANPSPAPAAPTAVEYKFDKIDGIDLTPEFDQDIVAVAKEMGWDQATAAKFRALEAKQAHQAMQADKVAREQAEAAAKVKAEQEAAQRRTEWEKANRDHKEFGGQKYAETNERVKQLLARFDKDQVFTKTHLKDSDEILHEPAFRSFLASIAYAMADGTFHQGTGSTTTEPKSLQEALFGSKPSAA